MDCCIKVFSMMERLLGKELFWNQVQHLLLARYVLKKNEFMLD